MDPDSQLLTTFNTPWGHYCFIKMPFGLNHAQYLFPYNMDLHLDGINETTNIIADDIMIHGESDLQHDKHLLQVLNKCQEIGLKLNPDKCIFGESSVPFYGNVISDQGLKPDPKKVDVIVKTPVPKDKVQLASFLGVCQYLSPYIPRLSNVTSTLRELNKKNTEFTWNATYDRAFRQVKLHVANAVTLKYFDPQAPIVIECDASGVGVGGVLLQNGQPVMLISQALTDTRKHYSNIESELLALVIVIEHLHHYVFGRQFMVHTDHAPLINLFNKCLNDTSPCLQRLLSRLSQYKMNVKYVTSKHVPVTDCLSRLINLRSTQEDDTLNLQIADLGVEPVQIDWQNVRRFTMNDPTLVRLAKVIQDRWPETGKELESDVKPYFQHRYELHIVDGVIFFQNRIVVPIGLKCQFLVKLHESHLGVVKLKLLARTLTGLTGMMSSVCNECKTCRENQHMPPNIPNFQVNARVPGEVYSCDVTEIQGRQHIVVVNYF